MTVSATSNKTIVEGDGVTSVFDYSFIAVSASYVSVIYTDADGEETLLDPSDYTLTINAAQPGQTWGVGGTVTYAPSGSPIEADTTLTIFRELPLAQAIQLANQSSYGQYASSTERGLDLVVMMIQQIADEQDRSFKVSISDPPPADVPPVAQRADHAAYFNSDGDLVPGDFPASGYISTAMQPVVGAATLAAGRTAFGLRGLAELGIGAGLEDDGSDAARVNIGFESVAVNRDVTAADHMKRLVVTGPITLSLDRLNTLWDGFEVFVEVVPGSGGSVILTPDSNDTILGASAAGASVVTPAGCSFSLSGNGLASGTWYLDLIPPVSQVPGGRLQLQTGVPTPLNDIASGSVYYESFEHGYAPVWNGAFMTLMAIGAGLSASLAAGYTASLAYDWFVTPVAGVLTLVSGPSWRNAGQFITGASNATPIVITAVAHGLQTGDVDVVSGVLGNLAANGQWTVNVLTADTYELVGSVGSGAYTAGTGQHAARGVGAGTTQLTRSYGGLWTNAVSMTARNGGNTFTVAPGQATWVGSGLMDASGNTMTATVRYGQLRTWPLFNNYWRLPVSLQVGDATATWTGNNAIGPANATANNKGTFFLGAADQEVTAEYHQNAVSAVGSGGSMGIQNSIQANYNATAVLMGTAGLSGTGAGGGASVSLYASGVAKLSLPGALGRNNMVAMEARAPTLIASATLQGGQEDCCMDIKFAA